MSKYIDILYRTSDLSDLMCFQFLRSLLDSRGIYDNSKAGKWKQIEDFNVFSAMRTPSQGLNGIRYDTSTSN